jgi:hypothetical protein
MRTLSAVESWAATSAERSVERVSVEPVQPERLTVRASASLVVATASRAMSRYRR